MDKNKIKYSKLNEINEENINKDSEMSKYLEKYSDLLVNKFEEKLNKK